MLNTEHILTIRAVRLVLKLGESHWNGAASKSTSAGPALDQDAGRALDHSNCRSLGLDSCFVRVLFFIGS